MAADGVRGELSCPVCLEIYTDPVTLPCGHNYCRGCIGKAWDPEMRGFGDKPSCPQCRRRYEKQPELRSNVTLWDLAERFLPIGPHHGTTGIPCTYCDSPVPAAMSCLLCEASLCATHVRVHSTAPEHVLTMPSVLLRHQNCSIHRERLRYRCTEDGARVCVSCCLAGGPRGHKVELLNGAPKKTHIQAMATADLRSNITCSLCREIYTDPVTLPCGHTYCRDCIGGTWESEEKMWGYPSCPECGETYPARPGLRGDRTLRNILESLVPSDPGTEILCTHCVMRYSDLRDKLTCPLCRGIYTDPVTLPCGHNYCLRCIGATLRLQEWLEDDPSCPECLRRYWIWPELSKNLKLRHIVRSFIVTHPEYGYPRVFCTYCIHSAETLAVPATKSCLYCGVSLCDDHVTRHSKSVEHILTKPTPKCSAHQELLRYRCTEDGAPVCVSCCLAGGHRGHRVKLLKEATKRRKIQGAAGAGLRDKLTCPLCRGIYTDPVTLPCGHNYCLRCIGGTWGEQKEKREGRSCPECKHKIKIKMELSKNHSLCNIVQFLLPPPEQRDPAGTYCTYCIHSLVPAAKSCLLCEASLCDKHVRVHSRAAEHVLTEPTASFGHRNCSAHGELLRYLCTEDGAPVCVSCCLAGGHRGHRVEMLNEEQE
ncbi:uncharacterized protein LOC100485658 [Xenopus tropicalis]|uniref:Uncharacterized protein LOC100485658 n=1 Tax=Xenopus tropicalis TaxID=8364 RepID=A0A8J0T112_XENTR|nr:uncharacterized protein LOC100485658 [Xenopus tropicalis]